MTGGDVASAEADDGEAAGAAPAIARIRPSLMPV